MLNGAKWRGSSLPILVLKPLFFKSFIIVLALWIYRFPRKCLRKAEIKEPVSSGINHVQRQAMQQNTPATENLILRCQAKNTSVFYC